ncbi:MAG: thioredoxin family protein [Bacteroidales bacterium]|nr:thioredoxin family protein [Bacteroidales bacterium]
MRKIFLTLVLIFSAALSHAQVLEPVAWSFRVDDKGNSNFEIVMTATLDDKWHLYAMDIEEGGPIATSFTFEPVTGYTLTGKAYEVTKPEVKFDNSFGMNIGMHSGTAEFRQKIKLTGPSAKVEGYVTFMSCDDKQCLPPRDVEFSLEVKGSGKPAVTTAADPKATGQTAVQTTGQSESGKPEATEAETGLGGAEDVAAAAFQSGDTATGEESLAETSAEPATGTTTEPATETPAEPKKGFMKFFLLSMLAGFAGILTPCVFPMIPMTVAFFSQGTGNKGSAIGKALIFGLSIILLYSSLGIIVSLTSAGAGFANTLSTHWIPNLLFFSLFLVFAASFFGAFEIVLPSKWVSSSDSKVDRGGALAAFFLGVTTVLVSFSCTGPIVGALLVEAASGDVLRPTIGMFGFGLAFALPFTLFALFPSWMQKMPKSGGWLNSVKVVLGFIMLAFSLKFASTVDTVYNLGILSRDIYLAIWIVLFVLLGIYLMGKIKFSHDSDVPHIGVFRLVLIIASFTFALYLVPGLFGAPLTRISALLPPRETSGFNLLKAISENRGVAPGAVSPGIAGTAGGNICDEPKYGDFLHFGYGLQGYFDLEQGLECARKLNKPVLIDFKGHACANCKEMDARVWSDAGVQQRLRENFVLVALYVDDRTKLPENEVYVSKVDGKEKKTMGKKNEDIEISMFNTNTLPLYAIVDPEGKPLIETRGTDFDIQAYIDWLDRGAEAFRSR